tara:strand:- start:1504 stop:1788 length:285 start_codon:yes stop_codon:yes gene_type:complete
MELIGKADVKVDVSFKDILNTLEVEVHKKLKLPHPNEGKVTANPHHDGNWRWNIKKDVNTSHSFQLEESLGPADDEDIEIFQAYHTLRFFLKDS